MTDGPERGDAVHLRAESVRAGVHDLRLDLGAVLVHRVDQLAVRRDGLVGAEVQAAGGLRVVVVDAGRPDGHQADATGGAGREVGDGALRRQPSGVPYIVSIGDITIRLRRLIEPIRPGRSRCSKVVIAATVGWRDARRRPLDAGRAGRALLVGSAIQGVVGLGVGLVLAPVIGLTEPELLPGLALWLAMVYPAAHPQP